MKKLFGDVQLEEARSCASAVQKSLAAINLSVDSGTKKYMVL